MSEDSCRWRWRVTKLDRVRWQASNGFVTLWFPSQPAAFGYALNRALSLAAVCRLYPAAECRKETYPVACQPVYPTS